MISKLKLLFVGYFFTIILLFFYSFTQVDLSLTLSQASWWQVVQKFLQQIGYFNRPLSSFIYLSIIILLFTFYVLFLRLARENKLNKKTLWIVILATSGILTFSYNAFSYDLFNYIFDAKIVTFYHQNPYAQKALDYLGDPMLTFMHWTHRTYPYGPSWLLLTTPLSIGIDFFLPTFFLFKFLISGFYIGTAYFISKIINLVSKEDEITGLVFFAFNPLVIIESLVSAHNDMAMMFFSVVSVYMFLKNKKILSVLSLLFSVGVKFATAFLVPVYIYYFLKKSQKFNSINFLNVIFFSMFVPLVFVTLRTNFQPWYLLYVIPFASLIPQRNYAVGVGIILSFFALLEYMPYIYRGDWNEPVSQILLFLTTAGFVLYLIYIFSSKAFKPDKKMVK